MDYKILKPRDIRSLCREGTFTGVTAGIANGYVQTNLVILPAGPGMDFEEFCAKNPKPCPLLEVIEDGSHTSRTAAPGADVCRDLPRYKIFRNGEAVAEKTDITADWSDDFYVFLIGCSFTFENELLDAGIPVRHIEEGLNVPMYRTSIDCVPVGKFGGKLIVSMRPAPHDRVDEAIAITTRYPLAHGAPVHVGNPSQIGIRNLRNPDYGDPVTVRENETAMFWACGVTPQEAIRHAKPATAITHAPGHMFITDIKDEELENWNC